MRHTIIALLFVVLGTTDIAAQTLSTSSGNMLPETMAYSIFIYPGVNLVSLPCKPIETWTVETLRQKVKSPFVAWEETTSTRPNGGFTTYLPGQSPDREIDPAKGYIVAYPKSPFKAMERAITVTGTPWSVETLTKRIHPGVNVVAFPRSVPADYSATQALRDLHLTSIARLTLAIPGGESRFEACIKGTGTDFLLEHGKGYVATASSEATIVLPERSRRLSSGTGIIFTWNDDFDPTIRHIYTMLPDGRNLKKIMSYSWFDTDPEYSPDGQVIIYSTAAFCRGGTVGIALTPATGERENLVALSGIASNGMCQSVEDRGAALSWEGQSILLYSSPLFFTTKSDIGFIPRAGGNPNRGYYDNFSVHNPTFARTSDTIFCLSEQEGQRKLYSGPVPRDIPLKASQELSKLSDRIITGDGLSVAPDDRIIFTSSGDIWCRYPDGREVNLTATPSTNEKEASFSPDGTRIVYVVVVREFSDEEYAVWIMDADGANQRLVRSFRHQIYLPKWRP